MKEDLVEKVAREFLCRKLWKEYDGFEFLELEGFLNRYWPVQLLGLLVAELVPLLMSPAKNEASFSLSILGSAPFAGGVIGDSGVAARSNVVRSDSRS